MIKKIIAASIISTFMTSGLATVALAGGEGGASDERPFITMKNPDGSTITSRGRGAHKITRRNKRGKVIKVRRRPKKGRSWAYNHTRRVGSVEVVPGRYQRRVVRGRMRNTHVGGVRLVISPFGFGFSF